MLCKICKYLNNVHGLHMIPRLEIKQFCITADVFYIYMHNRCIGLISSVRGIGKNSVLNSITLIILC